MNLTGAMAGNTGHIDILPGCVEVIFVQIIITLQSGGMAIGTHAVPILQGLGPMESVIMWHMVVTINMEPSLPPARFGAAVPGQGQDLIFTLVRLDQILLQGFNPKGIGDLKVLKAAVFTFRPDPILITLLKKMCGHPFNGDFAVLKIPQYRCRGRILHSLVMMRSGPVLSFLGVAVLTGCVPAGFFSGLNNLG